LGCGNAHLKVLLVGQQADVHLAAEEAALQRHPQVQAVALGADLGVPAALQGHTMGSAFPSRFGSSACMMCAAAIGSTAGGRKPDTLPVSFHQNKAAQMLRNYYHHNMTPHRPGIKQRGATRRAAEGAVDNRQRLHGQGARGAGQRNSITEGQVREEQLHHICLKRGLLLGRDGVQLGVDIGAEMAAACATVILLSSKIRQNLLATLDSGQNRAADGPFTAPCGRVFSVAIVTCSATNTLELGAMPR